MTKIIAILVLLSSTSTAQFKDILPVSSEPLLTAQLIHFNLLNALDLALTRLAIERGHVEDNPLFKPIIGTGWDIVLKTSGVLFINWSLNQICHDNKTLALVLSTVLNITYVIIVYHNIMILNSQNPVGSQR